MRKRTSLMRKFRSKSLIDNGSVKVLWKNDLVEEETLEAEIDMESHYPPLFTN